MSVTHAAGAGNPTGLTGYHGLVALLRDVDHWRRLVAARLDLAVAAVTDIDDLLGPDPDDALDAGPPDGPAPPDGLRDLLGIPPTEDAGDEAAALPRLRAVLAQLDAYAAALRPLVEAAAQDAGLDPPARPRLLPVPRPRSST